MPEHRSYQLDKPDRIWHRSQKLQYEAFDDGNFKRIKEANRSGKKDQGTESANGSKEGRYFSERIRNLVSWVKNHE